MDGRRLFSLFFSFFIAFGLGMYFFFDQNKGGYEIKDRGLYYRGDLIFQHVEDSEILSKTKKWCKIESNGLIIIFNKNKVKFASLK